MSIKARAGGTKSLNALINKDTSILGKILNKASYLKHLETILQQHLPEELKTAYRVANYQQQQLILLTSSAGYLTRMRFLQATLIQALKKELPGLQRIEVKVRPEPPAKRQQSHSRTISNHSRANLGKLAEQVDHPRLKAILQRLGQDQDK